MDPPLINDFTFSSAFALAEILPRPGGGDENSTVTQLTGKNNNNHSTTSEDDCSKNDSGNKRIRLGGGGSTVENGGCGGLKAAEASSVAGSNNSDEQSTKPSESEPPKQDYIHVRAPIAISWLIGDNLQSHKSFFEKSDLFFVCLMRPLTSDVQIQEIEIEAAKWMPFDDYAAQPFIEKSEIMRYISDIYRSKFDGQYSGFTPVSTKSTFCNQTSSYLYLNAGGLKRCDSL